MDSDRRLSLRQWFLISSLYRSEKQKKSFADGFTNDICEPKKSFSLEIYRRIFIPSVISWFTDGYLPSVTVSECMKYRPNIYVYEFVGKCGSNADGLSPSVRLSVSVTVRCRRINSVGKTLGNSFSKFVFKKLFRIYNIKLYKLMVIKTNYANKIYIKHQKKNQSQIIFITNWICFKKNIKWSFKGK